MIFSSPSNPSLREFQNPMISSNETSPEADYDAILQKLDTLLRKHQGNSSAPTGANGTTSGEEPSLTAADNIPTLTETVSLPSAMLSPQSDITSLLEQILDSALKDAGTDLTAGARTALVQALECRLFGL
jgi:hypothetical protein